MHVNKNKLPPGTDPKYSQPKFLPVQENILPYKKPDGHQTPVDKMHTAFNMRQGTNISSKTPHQMSPFIKQYKYTSTYTKGVKINSNKIALPSAQQEHHQNKIQNRSRNK